MKASLSLDEQIEALTKLKSLLDAGILSQEEFDRKKKKLWIYKMKLESS